MNCNNCGTVNVQGSKNCVKCGNALVSVQPVQNFQPQSVQNVQPQPTQNIQTQAASNNMNVTQSQIESQPVQNISNQPVMNNMNVAPVSASTSSAATLDYIAYVIAFLLKPFQAFKEEENKFNDLKTAGIFSGIIVVAMMIINLLTSIISAVFVKKIDPSTFKLKTSFDIAGLKNLDYVSLIFKNLLIVAAIILVIAGVYYIGTLILKKTVNFSKLLAATASSMIPYAVLSMLIATIFGKIWTPLSIIIFFVGLVYSLIIFAFLISNIISFDNNDIKIKFNAICISILVLGGGYILYRLLLSDAMGSLSGLSGVMF